MKQWLNVCLGWKILKNTWSDWSLPLPSTSSPCLRKDTALHTARNIRRKAAGSRKEGNRSNIFTKVKDKDIVLLNITLVKVKVKCHAQCFEDCYCSDVFGFVQTTRTESYKTKHIWTITASWELDIMLSHCVNYLYMKRNYTNICTIQSLK